VKECLKELFKPDGVYSWSRTASAVALFCVIVWISFTLYKNPDPLKVLKETPWFELSAFVATFYLLGKSGETAQSIFNAVKK
jgi:hypothetical protein